MHGHEVGAGIASRRRATKEHIIQVSEIVIDESEIALGDVRSGVMGRGRDVCPLLRP